MIPLHCLQSLKPNDIVILDANQNDHYRFRNIQRLSEFEHNRYGFRINVLINNGKYPISLYEKIHNITKIIKQK